MEIIYKYLDCTNGILEHAVKTACTNPKISIIVPVYNTEKYLPRCIESLIRQTLKEIEIILVDDGSTDSCPDIIKEYSSIDSRIKILTQNNQKQGAARNRGTEVANGEFIGFVDSDDWIDDDFYQKLYEAASRNNSDIALATNVRIGNGKTKKRLDIQKETLACTLQEKIDLTNQSKNPCPTNKIYRSTMLKNNNITWPEGVYCEDKLFTIEAVYFANSVVSVPNVNYYYFRNPSSTVNKNSVEHKKKKLDDRNSANKAVLDFLKSKNAQVRDKEFWAVINEIRIFGVSVYKEQISLKTVRKTLLGIKIEEHELKEAN